MMGHFGKDESRKDQGKGKGGDGSKRCAKGKGKTMTGAGKTGSGKSGGHKGGPSEEANSCRYQGSCWTNGRVGHQWAECRWRVAGVEEEDVDCRKSEDNLTEEDEEVGGVWIVWNVEELEEEDGTRDIFCS